MQNQSRGTHFAVQVGSIEEAVLRRNGVTYRPRKHRPDGAWQIFLADPDGHLIELTDLSSLKTM